MPIRYGIIRNHIYITSKTIMIYIYNITKHPKYNKPITNILKLNHFLEIGHKIMQSTNADANTRERERKGKAERFTLVLEVVHTT